MACIITTTNAGYEREREFNDHRIMGIIDISKQAPVGKFPFFLVILKAQLRGKIPTATNARKIPFPYNGKISLWKRFYAETVVRCMTNNSNNVESARCKISLFPATFIIIIIISSVGNEFSFF